MPSLQVRNLPEHIYQEIVKLAKDERRSITQETIVLLEIALNLKKDNRNNRKKLLEKIKKETEEEKQTKENFLDPVKLIREDRER